MNSHRVAILTGKESDTVLYTFPASSVTSSSSSLYMTTDLYSRYPRIILAGQHVFYLIDETFQTLSADVEPEGVVSAVVKCIVCVDIDHVEAIDDIRLVSWSRTIGAISTWKLISNPTSGSGQVLAELPISGADYLISNLGHDLTFYSTSDDNNRNNYGI